MNKPELLSHVLLTQRLLMNGDTEGVIEINRVLIKELTGEDTSAVERKRSTD